MHRLSRAWKVLTDPSYRKDSSPEALSVDVMIRLPGTTKSHAGRMLHRRVKMGEPIRLKFLDGREVQVVVGAPQWARPEAK